MGFFEDHGGDAFGAWPLLVKIQFTGGTVYWTDRDIPVCSGAGSSPGQHRWRPRPMQIPDGITSRQLEVSGASVEIGNADNLVLAILFAEGSNGVLADIWEAAFLDTNKSARPDAYRHIFSGRVQAPRAPRSGLKSSITLTLGPRCNLAAKTGPGDPFTNLLRT